MNAARRADDEDLEAVYSRTAAEGRDRLAWSWSTLSVAQRHQLAERLDHFVALYNRHWAVGGAVVPPCWYRHPALAHDLAALAWAHYGAYRDPSATPGAALRFQESLPRFAGRLERWLAPDPNACRTGNHPPRPPEEVPTSSAPAPDTEEKRDTVTLLGHHGL